MAKYRVYEIAKELGLNSKELMELLLDMGIDVKSHMTALSEEDFQRVMTELSPNDPSIPAKDEDVGVEKIQKQKLRKPSEEEELRLKRKKAIEKDIEDIVENKKTDKKKVKGQPSQPEEASIKITAPITVKDYAEKVEKSTSEIIMKLMEIGVMANINQDLDKDTLASLSEALDIQVIIERQEEEEKEIEKEIEDFEDKPEDLKPRSPVITVMGHVDHGKTSLLDTIRKSKVTEKESGGITQHIGASEVHVGQKKIVFLDTPGHKAFTAMRARGAKITDIAILVVAADDGVKPQTVEAISHAKAANVPILVALNKIDKPDVNPTKVKQELSDNGLLVEEWGGDVICVPVSATTGEGIDQLLEMILLMSEMLELKANPNRLAKGIVIEARLDKAKGPVATILVQNGSLEVGMPVVAGDSYGKVRAMTNSLGNPINEAGPSTAIEILGLSSVPEAGDVVNAVREDRTARLIAERRVEKTRNESLNATTHHVTLEDLFDQIQQGQVKDLNIIVKADVQGSVGALCQSLVTLSDENVKINIIHSGVGTVNEYDILLASASNAIIIGFNVRPSSSVTSLAEKEKVDIKNYRIIYEAIDDIQAAMKGLLDPEYKEVILGKIEVRATFKVPNAGTIAGAYVLEGKVLRNAEVRLVRDGIIIYEGKISSLKRFKDDAKEVATGYECGIGLDNYNDLKEGDIIEAFKMEEIKR